MDRRRPELPTGATPTHRRVYATCLFCHGPLGHNDVVETFPVGRTLAFDAAKGRLWVVCRRCARWNLTPLEERWEAIESCERLFRAVPLRAATEHVQLAHAPDGTRLIRIGAAPRSEVAAWRYNREFRRRRRAEQLSRVAVMVGSALGGMLCVAALPGTLGLELARIGGLVGGGVVGAVQWRASSAQTRWQDQAPVATVSTPEADGDHILRAARVSSARLFGRPTAPGGWMIQLGYRTIERDRKRQRLFHHHVELEGDAAVRALRTLLPRMNAFGGTRDQVDDAVALLGVEADGVRLTSTLVAEIEARITNSRDLGQIPRADLLALEMALAEDTERQAMDGEVAALERAWREAEAIAAIADDLALPGVVRTRWQVLRRG